MFVSLEDIVKKTQINDTSKRIQIRESVSKNPSPILYENVGISIQDNNLNSDNTILGFSSFKQPNKLSFEYLTQDTVTLIQNDNYFQRIDNFVNGFYIEYELIQSK